MAQNEPQVQCKVLFAFLVQLCTVEGCKGLANNPDSLWGKPIWGLFDAELTGTVRKLAGDTLEDTHQVGFCVNSFCEGILLVGSCLHLEENPVLRFEFFY